MKQEPDPIIQALRNFLKVSFSGNPPKDQSAGEGAKRSLTTEGRGGDV